jgi:hypothetical protein
MTHDPPVRGDQLWRNPLGRGLTGDKLAEMQSAL